MHVLRSGPGPRFLAPAVLAIALAAGGCGGGDDDGAPSPRPESADHGDRAPAAAPAGVRVPQIAGAEIDHARHRAERVGLTLAVSGYVGKYGNGRYNVRCVKVLRQSPVAGERLAKGSKVYVILKECRTPKTAPVPPAGTT
jgi:hypothetical protein